MIRKDVGSLSEAMKEWDQAVTLLVSVICASPSCPITIMMLPEVAIMVTSNTNESFESFLELA